MLSGATLIILQVWGLGYSELVLILLAILFLIAPNSLQTIKPFVKVAYKKWREYLDEVKEVQGEMEGMKQSLMKPLKEAKAEAEAEMRLVENDLRKNTQETMQLKKEIKSLMDQNRIETKQGSGQVKQEKPVTEPKLKAKKAKDKGAV